MRLSPKPPALRLIRNTGAVAVLEPLDDALGRSRVDAVEVAVRDARARPAAAATMRRKPVNWLKTRARCPSATSSRAGRRSASILPRRTSGVARRRPARGRRLSCRSRVSDRKIANRLRVDVVDQAEHLLPLALQVRLVDAAVPRVQLDLQHLLLLRRQVGGDLLLGAAQHERPDAAAQLASSSASPPFSIGLR